MPAKMSTLDTAKPDPPRSPASRLLQIRVCRRFHRLPGLIVGAGLLANRFGALRKREPLRSAYVGSTITPRTTMSCMNASQSVRSPDAAMSCPRKEESVCRLEL